MPGLRHKGNIKSHWFFAFVVYACFFLLFLYWSHSWWLFCARLAQSSFPFSCLSHRRAPSAPAKRQDKSACFFPHTPSLVPPQAPHAVTCWLYLFQETPLDIQVINAYQRAFSGTSYLNSPFHFHLSSHTHRGSCASVRVQFPLPFWSSTFHEATVPYRYHSYHQRRACY